MSIVLNVFFDDRCWVTLFIKKEDNTEKYAWILFEKEPSDVELYKYVLDNYYSLKFSDIYQVEGSHTPAKKPKRC